MAEQLIESLAGEWDPKKYHDTYQERVLDLIKRKAKGEDIVVQPEEKTPEVADLMEALRASVEASKGGKKPPSAATRAPDLHDLSKDELYEKAGEADIAGRSKMSKEELIEALEGAVTEAS